MKKAFTLIELLVVIAIIAILAAILFPVFAQAKTAAKKTVDLSNMKQLMTGLLMYSNDSDDSTLYCPYYPSGSATLVPEDLWWTDQLMPYVKNTGIYSTPGANGIPVYAPPANAYRYPGTTEDNATTAQIVAQGYRNTYALNQVMSKADDDFAFQTGHLSADILSSVPSPASITYFGPGLDWYEWSACQFDAGGSQQVDLFWASSLDANAAGSWGWGYETFNMDGNPSDAGYTGGANFAYCDGHAKFTKMVLGGDLVYPTSSTFGGLIAGWYPGVKTWDKAATGAAACPTGGDMGAFEASN